MVARPFLTAEWRNLLFLNFPVDTDIIARFAPPGTEPDLHQGKSYISIVGFQFDRVRLCGIPIPGHTSFPEINLRYYVRRTVAGEVRRGVVFVREIVPRRAVSIVANRLYNENYVTRPMRTENQIAGTQPSPQDIVAYSWRSPSHKTFPLPFREGLGEGSFSRNASTQFTNRLSAQVACPLAPPVPGSLEEFIIEHYWGYSRGRDNQTREYQVAHIPWRVATATDIDWTCDVANNYGPPFAEFLAASPANAAIAEGSSIKVFRQSRS